jgi:hypothetical protein
MVRQYGHGLYNERMFVIHQPEGVQQQVRSRVCHKHGVTSVGDDGEERGYTRFDS